VSMTHKDAKNEFSEPHLASIFLFSRKLVFRINSKQFSDFQDRKGTFLLTVWIVKPRFLLADIFVSPAK